MAIQSGVTVAGPNQAFKVVTDIRRPTPGPKEALVKSLVVGLNPVEPFMQAGVLVTEWPAVLGSDGYAVVLEVGEGCERLKKGDCIYSCMLVGQNLFSPFQDTYLVKEDLVFKKNASMSAEQACTVGAGLFTAALSVLSGLSVALPPPGTKAEPKDSWVIVMGGSGSVGQYACQLASLCGYKVLASTSLSKAQLAIASGATSTFNNRAPAGEQLAEIRATTDGKFGRVFDASVQAYDLSIKALETVSREAAKYFSTADDWSEMKTPASIKEYRTQLGQIGREGPVGDEVSRSIKEWIPTFEAYIEAGALKALEYQVVPGVGWEKVIEGLADLTAGKAAKKIVVKVQDG